MADEKVVSAGTVFLVEGETSRSMYLIRAGRARVYKTYQDTKILIAQLGPGDICGEMALFDSGSRSASVEAVTDVTLVVIDADEGARRMRELPEWAQSAFRTLAKRIRDVDQQLMALRSVAEYEKKAHRIDTFTRTLYVESRRMLRLLEVVWCEANHQGKNLLPDDFRARLMDLIGPQLIPFERVWEFVRDRQLLRFAPSTSTQSAQVLLDSDQLKKLLLSLDSEIGSGRFIFLNDPARTVLERLVSLSNSLPEDEFLREQIVSHGVRMPDLLYSEGMRELAQRGLIRTQADLSIVCFKKDELHEVQSLQDLLHRVDRSVPVDHPQEDSRFSA